MCAHAVHMVVLVKVQVLNLGARKLYALCDYSLHLHRSNARLLQCRKCGTLTSIIISYMTCIHVEKQMFITKIMFRRYIIQQKHRKKQKSTFAFIMTTHQVGLNSRLIISYFSHQFFLGSKHIGEQVFFCLFPWRIQY